MIPNSNYFCTRNERIGRVIANSRRVIWVLLCMVLPCNQFSWILIQVLCTTNGLNCFMVENNLIFSSPEPKAHGELIVSSRAGVSLCVCVCVCVCVCLCVHIFKHEYLLDQWANCNQILSEASLGRGKECIRFWTRSDQNSGVNGNG